MKIKYNKSFTLIELLVAITIISILSSMVFISVKTVINKAYSVRTRQEIRALSLALQLYSDDNNNNFPCDVNRDLPPGLEQYISSNPAWPKAPWPGSVYDWDFWSNPVVTNCSGSIANTPFGQVYQISIRFCDIGGGNCNFPNESWAVGFDSKSSVYWCISGPCRAHGSMPYNHPGCCIGGACPSNQPRC